MSEYQSEFLKTLHARGFIHQCTDDSGLDSLLASQTAVPAYIGFDCTAPSLHVGSLLQIMTLFWYQRCGHKPIVLLGGGTTKVGDPSGKDESRKLLDAEQIEKNKAGIKEVFSKFLTFEETYDPKSSDAYLVDNAEWLDGLNYIEFLRDYGRHFSVNHMLSMESVKLRLEREHHLSFLEFNYMILQAYDFVELQKRYGCRLQIGGSDQWGNIVNGVELQRRLLAVNSSKPVELFGLTTSLITTASGAKMGKTAEGAVWLDTEMLTPYDYWQFWRNTEDADVVRFMKFFTDMPMEEIGKFSQLQGAEINEAKKTLADLATEMCHGIEASQEARRTAERTFEQGKIGDSLPTLEVPRLTLEEGIPAFKLFHEAGLADSGGAARRLIRQGGGKLNGEKITDEQQLITAKDLSGEGIIKLSAGKKKHALVKAA